MRGGYKRVANSEDESVERERLRKAKEGEEKRIRYDRFRVAASLALIIVVAFAATILGMCVKELVEVTSFRSKASVEFRLSRVLVALINETTASVQFVKAADNTKPDRVLEAEIEAYQTATREAFTEAASSNDDCEICPNVLGTVDLESLLYAQRNVLRRSYTPLNCLLAYRNVVKSLTETMNYFLGYTLRDGIVDIVWFQNILLGVRSVGMIIPGIMSGDITLELIKSMYYDVSTCIASLDNVDSSSYSLILSAEGWRNDYTTAVTPPYNGGVAALNGIEVDLTGMTVVEDKSTVEKTLEDLTNIYKALLDKLEKDEPWRKYSISLQVVTIVTSGLAIVLSVAAIIILLYSALSIIWVSPESLYGMRHQERVESSLERMEFFVDRVYDLDLDGVAYAAQRSAESKSITSAERDLLRLAPKLIQVLAFINPNIYTFRQNFLLNNNEDSAVHIAVAGDMNGDTESLNPFGTQKLVAAENYESTSTGKRNSAAASSVVILPNQENAVSSSLTDTKLVSQSVCFILADISCFFNEVTPETSKVTPIDISNFMALLLKLVKANGGNYITTTGSVVVTAFNESEVQDAENTCVMVLVSIQQHILSSFPKIRCAMISSIVPQGIIGSPSLKAYITDGDVLTLGELLIRIARLHDATFVVDSATFMKIDTQYFYKLALEQIGIDERDLGSTTTVYELVPHGRDASSYLWNEAFDQFHAGDFDQAKEKMRLWRHQHGATVSWKRFNSLLNAVPQPRPVTFLFASGDNFEPNFFIH